MISELLKRPNRRSIDSRGRAVAYLAGDGDLTMLWAGKPVAYLDKENEYGFNGNHLGWIENSAKYDHDGNIVAASSAFSLSPITI